MTDPLTIAAAHRALAEQFAQVGADLVTAPDLAGAFVLIAQLGLKTISGAEHAGITVLRRGQFDTPTATSDLPPQVDAIQYELGSGPCVDAVTDGAVYRTGDLESDPRWPEFGKRAVAETDVQSMLAVRLFCEQPDLQAALNLYATQRDAFDESSVPIAMVLATHASLALTAAARQEQIGNLEQALGSNRQIGVAIGVLMTRHLVTEQQAFDLLRMASQRSHRKLRDVAQLVTESGDIDLS